MKNLKYLLVVLPLVCLGATTIMWYSQQPAATVLQDTMVIAVEKASPQGYQKTTLASLKTYTLHDLAVSNYYVYPTNFWISNTYVSNYVTTNVYNDTYASNYFWTNIYISQTYSTNVSITNFYQTDSYVSNFFNTNIYVNDTYVSNYFTTNLYTTTIVTNYTDGVHVAAGTGITAVTNGNLVTLGSAGGDQVWTNDGSFITPLDVQPVWIGDTSLYDNSASPLFGGGWNLQTNSSGTLEAMLFNINADSATNAAITGMYIDLLNADPQNQMQDTTTMAVANDSYASGPKVGVSVAVNAWDSSETENYAAGIVSSVDSYKERNLGIGSLVSVRNSTTNAAVVGLVKASSVDSSVNATAIGVLAAISDSNQRPFLNGNYIYPSTALLVQNDSTNTDSVVVITNGVRAASISKHGVVTANAYVATEYTWAGATNGLGLGEFTYTAYTPCAVTNLTTTGSALLSITNASSSNITFTVHSPIRIPYGETSRTYTLTNGDVFFGSFRKGTHGSAFVPRGFWQP